MGSYSIFLLSFLHKEAGASPSEPVSPFFMHSLMNHRGSPIHSSYLHRNVIYVCMCALYSCITLAMTNTAPVATAAAAAAAAAAGGGGHHLYICALHPLVNDIMGQLGRSSISSDYESADEDECYHSPSSYRGVVCSLSLIVSWPSRPLPLSPAPFSFFMLLPFNLS